MQSSYTVGCPICDEDTSVSIGESKTIYYVEAYQDRNSIRGLIGTQKPDQKVGKKQLVDDRWVEISDVMCPQKHHINIYHTHYTYIDPEDQLHGPADKPSVYCPDCKYELDKHENHIVRLDSDLDMQYILRSVSRSESTNHKFAKAITKKLARSYNQICTPHRCPHCDTQIYFNYSSRNIKKAEGYEGIKQF